MVHLLIEKMEEYAKVNNIPIMETEGIDFLLEYIKTNKVKKILEIGTAIGYSAIRMALIDKEILITTIERDEKRYNVALANIKETETSEQIELILGDANEVDIDGTYDLVFIDAAKSSYIKFFNKYKLNLSPNGVIISDNLNFHGLVDKKIESKNLRQLVRKINEYVLFLKENKEFETNFYELGDGVSISKAR